MGVLLEHNGRDVFIGFFLFSALPMWNFKLLGNLDVA
jgi:hypothetical protein